MISTTEPHDSNAGCEVPRPAAWFSHCHVHAVDEPWDCDTFRVCGECGHVFPTVADLLADHAALVERLNAHPITPPSFFPAPPLVAKTDPTQIWSCPHCAHDF